MHTRGSQTHGAPLAQRFMELHALPSTQLNTSPGGQAATSCKPETADALSWVGIV
jgi:hypothetical protein